MTALLYIILYILMHLHCSFASYTSLTLAFVCDFSVFLLGRLTEAGFTLSPSAETTTLFTHTIESQTITTEEPITATNTQPDITDSQTQTNQIFDSATTFSLSSEAPETEVLDPNGSLTATPQSATQSVSFESTESGETVDSVIKSGTTPFQEILDETTIKSLPEFSTKIIEPLSQTELPLDVSFKVDQTTSKSIDVESASQDDETTVGKFPEATTLAGQGSSEVPNEQSGFITTEPQERVPAVDEGKPKIDSEEITTVEKENETFSPLTTGDTTTPVIASEGPRVTGVSVKMPKNGVQPVVPSRDQATTESVVEIVTTNKDLESVTDSIESAKEKPESEESKIESIPPTDIKISIPPDVTPMIETTLSSVTSEYSFPDDIPVDSDRVTASVSSAVSSSDSDPIRTTESVPQTSSNTLETTSQEDKFETEVTTIQPITNTINVDQTSSTSQSFDESEIGVGDKPVVPTTQSTLEKTTKTILEITTIDPLQPTMAEMPDVTKLTDTKKTTTSKFSEITVTESLEATTINGLADITTLNELDITTIRLSETNMQPGLPIITTSEFPETSFEDITTQGKLAETTFRGPEITTSVEPLEATTVFPEITTSQGTTAEVPPEITTSGELQETTNTLFPEFTTSGKSPETTVKVLPEITTLGELQETTFSPEIRTSGKSQETTIKVLPEITTSGELQESTTIVLPKSTISEKSKETIDKIIPEITTSEEPSETTTREFPEVTTSNELPETTSKVLPGIVSGASQETTPREFPEITTSGMSQETTIREFPELTTSNELPESTTKEFLGITSGVSQETTAREFPEITTSSVSQETTVGEFPELTTSNNKLLESTTKEFPGITSGVSQETTARDFPEITTSGLSHETTTRSFPEITSGEVTEVKDSESPATTSISLETEPAMSPEITTSNEILSTTLSEPKQDRTTIGLLSDTSTSKFLEITTLETFEGTTQSMLPEITTVVMPEYPFNVDFKSGEPNIPKTDETPIEMTTSNLFDKITTLPDTKFDEPFVTRPSTVQPTTTVSSEEDTTKSEESNKFDSPAKETDPTLLTEVTTTSSLETEQMTTTNMTTLMGEPSTTLSTLLMNTTTETVRDLRNCTRDSDCGAGETCRRGECSTACEDAAKCSVTPLVCPPGTIGSYPQCQRGI